MDHFTCELQIEDILNESELEAIANCAVEIIEEGITPVINLGIPSEEISGQLKFEIK